MNTADRSLAMMDYALRRRFRFFTIPPAFDTTEFEDNLKERGAKSQLIMQIVDRFTELNKLISGNKRSLGPGFQIGHSYFCDTTGDSGNHEEPDRDWYENIVEYEIRPLLEEYWFDDLEEAKTRVERLLE